MTYKIIRACLLGVFIGIAGALTITLGMFLKKLYQVGKPAIEAAEVLSSFDSDENKDDLEGSIIRFHVKANSNSEEDMNLKYAVRDQVLDALSRKLMNCETMEETEHKINDNLSALKQVAEKTIRSKGYNYAVKVYLTYDEFPMRQYGELVLPAGKYRALRVDIGEAKGENFWCLLYPAMCYTSDSGAVLSREDGKEIKKELSEEDYDRLFVRKSVPRKQIKYKLKIVEWFEGLM